MAYTKGESPGLCSQLCLVGAVVRVRANRVYYIDTSQVLLGHVTTIQWPQAIGDI